MRIAFEHQMKVDASATVARSVVLLQLGHVPRHVYRVFCNVVISIRPGAAPQPVNGCTISSWSPRMTQTSRRFGFTLLCACLLASIATTGCVRSAGTDLMPPASYEGRQLQPDNLGARLFGDISATEARARGLLPAFARHSWVDTIQSAFGPLMLQRHGYDLVVSAATPCTTGGECRPYELAVYDAYDRPYELLLAIAEHAFQPERYSTDTPSRTWERRCRWRIW
jgi:hypothetical protein